MWFEGIDIFRLMVGTGAIVISLLSSYHIITTKDDVRAAIGWVGLVWLVPYVGGTLYFILGINRIRRKAVRVRREKLALPERQAIKLLQQSADRLPSNLPIAYRSHEGLMERVTQKPLTDGNHIQSLLGGHAAYGEMLSAIGAAKKSIALATYIFSMDDVGRSFVSALGEAQKRGVRVCVLIDGIGELYHFPFASRALRKLGVKVAHFNRTITPWRMGFMNLRNHRKILVVDGGTGFTGGMNIRGHHAAPNDQKRAINDIHFKLEGPVVSHLMDAFADDWTYVTGDLLEGSDWFPDITVHGDSKNYAIARGIPDGPDADMDKMNWAIRSALAMAQKSILIMTPYFLPDRLLVAGINHSALRGVEVTVILPEKNNLPMVSWAAQAQYARLLNSGCKIYHSPPPFDHSKILVVDSFWLLFGSTNWDSRSLRLNFEFNVECYDRRLAKELIAHTNRLKEMAEPITIEKVQSRGLFHRLLFGLAWLFSPYL